MSWLLNQKASIKFHLCLELFVFLFLLFQAEHLITMAITTINMIFICSTTWNCATYLMITRANRLAHRVSSIHQNQIRAFIHPEWHVPLTWWLMKDRTCAAKTKGNLPKFFFSMSQQCMPLLGRKAPSFLLFFFLRKQRYVKSCFGPTGLRSAF